MRVLAQRRPSLAVLACTVALAFAPASAFAQGADGPSTSGTLGGGTRADDPDTRERPSDTPGLEGARAPRPPPMKTTFLQFGLALTGEIVASAGAMCAQKSEPCVLGSGGGVAARAGVRPGGNLYLGGAYEISKQDPSSIYRLATLQQLRAEARLYIPTGRDTEPYVGFGAGVVAYGNEGAIETYGPMLFAGIGVETQISRTSVVGVALAYRTMYFTPFDLAGIGHRAGSFAHVIGLDVTLEALDPR